MLLLLYHFRSLAWPCVCVSLWLFASKYAYALEQLFSFIINSLRFCEYNVTEWRILLFHSFLPSLSLSLFVRPFRYEFMRAKKKALPNSKQ